MSKTMKAMTYYGENDVRFEDRPVPTIIDSTDAIIRVTKTTICGTDLGIMKGKTRKSKQLPVKKPENGKAVSSVTKPSAWWKKWALPLKTSKKAIKLSYLA